MAKPVIKKNESADNFAVRLLEWNNAQAALPVEERDPDYVEGEQPAAVSTAKVAVEEKMVKFRAFMDHKCTIGKQTVILVKDQESRIPESHAMILMNAKKGFMLN